MIHSLDPGDEPINLTQVLKLSGLVENGGQAKALIGEGRVKVNGFVEQRKRRKMADGDLIEVEGLSPLRLLRRQSEDIFHSEGGPPPP